MASGRSRSESELGFGAGPINLISRFTALFAYITFGLWDFAHNIFLNLQLIPGVYMLLLFSDHFEFFFLSRLRKKENFN